MSVRSMLSVAIVAAAIAPPIARAEQAPTTAAPAPQTVPPFVVQTDNGDNRLQLAALLQFDGRFTVDDRQHNVTDTFLARRIRPILQGRVAKYFDFYLALDFAGAAVNVRDAYFDTHFSNAFRIRAGKGKVPFGLERLHGAANLLFVERAMPTTVAPDRDFQVQVLGDVAGGIFSYAGSVGNGVVDGGSDDIDVNGGKDVAGRVVVKPWARDATHRLSGLGLALAGSTGTQPVALPSFKTSGQQIYFSYATGSVGEGKRARVSPQAFYYSGPFGGFAEYVRSTGSVRRAFVTADIDHVAWQVAASWVLTGEAASDHGVRPHVNFDPARGAWGALQLAARYHQLTVDQDAVTLGLAAPNASRKAQAWPVGANWYLNAFIKWVLNVERTVLDGDADGSRLDENLVVFRAQLSF